MAIIGIDLGTTNSLCCVWQYGKCVLIPNSLGDYLTPSVVSADENGDILVGKTAKERLISHPGHTASSFKQFMGTDKVYILGKKRFHPEDLSSMILRRLKEDAESFLGEAVTEAIISVPAYFNNNQRSMTKLAGELAGLKVERIINEPSAAAIAYQHATGNDGFYLVVDFGGGTLDISVVDIFENIVDIIAVAGDNHLGGDDIDNIIVDAFYELHPILDQKLSPNEKASVKKMAEQCKMNLTTSEQALMVYVYKGKRYELLLTNQILLDLCAPILAKIKLVLRRALKDSSRSVNEIDAVIAVGGSGKMPIVQSFLMQLTGKAPLCSIDPDKAVALGVGIVTGIKTRDADIRDVVMTDICPFTLGTRVFNRFTNDKNEYSPIIERNTALPVSRERNYFTMHDLQTRVIIDIYQGESLSVVNNLLLGQLEVSIPPAKAGEIIISLRFSYDINGILEVDATCEQTGDTEHVLILTNKNLSSAEITKRRQELQELKTPPREQEENRYLLERGARIFEESTGQARMLIQHETTLFSSILENSRHPTELEKAKHRFAQIVKMLDEGDDKLFFGGAAE